MKRAAFFFGAGISRASGKPLAPEITEAALNGQWHLHTNQSFNPGPHPSHLIPDKVTPTVQKFLLTVNKFANRYLAELSRTRVPRKPHYEDLFSLAQQAARSETDYVPNLAVAEFLGCLRDATKLLHSGFKGGTQGGDGLYGLAETACDCLHWVVHHELADNTKPRAGLNVITQTAKVVDELDIFTLNHDTLVEEQCKSEDVPFQDGFAERRGEFRVFSGWPEKPREKVRLFKLHGSLNWYLCRFLGSTDQYAIPENGASHSRDQNGNLVTNLGGKAAFLSGTIVKEQLYGIGFFGDLFAAFRNHLASHKHLIFCGYGFGDPGINHRILQWLHDRLDGSNRIVVLAQATPEEFLADKPLWLRLLHEERRVILVNKWLQNCEVADLAPYFDN